MGPMRLLFLPIAAALLLGAAAGPPPQDAAEALLETLDRSRREAGAGPLRREPVLDRIAAARAAEVAGKPEAGRFDPRSPVESALKAAGVRRWLRASEHLQWLSGYSDVAAAVAASWRKNPTAWASAMERGWNAAGAATVTAADGAVVVLVLLVERETIPADLEALEAATVAAVDAVREREGLGPLVPDPRAVEAARAHSRDMARGRFLAHDSPTRGSFVTRLNAAAVAHLKAAENVGKILRETDPVRAAVDGWMDSPGHRANILTPAYDRTGVGIAVDDEGAYYFTQIFIEAPRP